MLHKTAIISKKAHIDSDVSIGPYAIIEDDVVIGKGTKIMAFAYIANGTSIGKDCEVHIGAILGHIPQDIKFKKCKSFLKIGDKNIFREYSTVHRATEENSSTTIGNNNYFMGLSHIAHNCVIGNNVIICNGSLLAGYVKVEDRAFISGNVVVHQFVRIGELSMIGGLARVVKDVPPYMLVEGDSIVKSINLVGMRRADFDEGIKREIKTAYKLLYRSNLNTTNALKEIERLYTSREVKHLVSFIKDSKRGICSS